jgi:hypothetical protein
MVTPHFYPEIGRNAPRAPEKVAGTFAAKVPATFFALFGASPVGFGAFAGGMRV